MKLYKILFLSSLLAIPLKASVAQDGDNQSLLLNCPNEIHVAISSYLKPQENLNFRQTCKVIMRCVDDSYQYNLKKDFNTFLERNKEVMPLLPPNYLKSLTTSILQEEGYLFASQGSDLEGYLDKYYTPINLYPFLQKNMAWTQELFQAFFDRQIPQDKTELALKLLTACIPINRIYNTQEADPSLVVQKFKEDSHKSLITALKTMNKQHSYFLVGIDDDKDRLKTGPHFIVATQSNTSDLLTLDREGYLQKDHPHILIYNADQKVLTVPELPLYIDKLIITNGNNQCASIGNGFLSDCSALTSLELRGLSNLMSIGDNFLMYYSDLTSVKLGRLPKVTSIGRNFLHNCPNLTSVELHGLSNLMSIGDYFLNGCPNMTSMKLHGLSNSTSIGNNFLGGYSSFPSSQLAGLPNAASPLIANNKSLHRLGSPR